MLSASRVRSRFGAAARQLVCDIAYGIDAASAIRHGLQARPSPPRRTHVRRLALPPGAKTVRLGDYPAGRAEQG